jgi:C4-type Zn-finger protein
MEIEYTIDCPICDIQTIVRVPYEDDIPRHCPMCSSDIEAESSEEE